MQPVYSVKDIDRCIFLTILKNYLNSSRNVYGSSALINISKGLFGGEKLWAGDVVLAAPLIARQITIQVCQIFMPF